MLQVKGISLEFSKTARKRMKKDPLEDLISKAQGNINVNIE